MAKARGTDATQGIVVETWLSATGHPEISSFTNPYPSDIRHHISVDSNAGYPLDFHVYAEIASGYPQVAYTNPAADKWDKEIRNLIDHGEADQTMQVATLGSPARVQAIHTEFESSWSGPTTAILDKIPEVTIDVN